MFQNLVIRVVGEGSEVSFWRAKWATHESLGKSFTRIFLNLEQKDNMVVDMDGWNREEWNCELQWRRPWFQ